MINKREGCLNGFFQSATCLKKGEMQ